MKVEVELPIFHVGCYNLDKWRKKNNYQDKLPAFKETIDSTESVTVAACEACLTLIGVSNVRS